jgi:N-acetylmuramoyl-L-alanine amidase
VYKVQLCAGSKKLDLKPSNFKGLKNISKEFNKNLYKYFYGETSNLEEAKKKQQEAKNKGYVTAFIIKTKNGKSIYLKD